MFHSAISSVPFIGLLLILSFAGSTKSILYLTVAGYLFLSCLIGFSDFAQQSIHTIIHHFIPFIVIIATLYIVSSHIAIKINAPASPLQNSIFIFIGSIMAAIMGTSGASLVLINPLLQMNKDRKNKTHTILCFIFLVSNIGGILSTLGDPPLFVGFLNGVDFFWPTINMWPHYFFIAIPVLCVYFMIDSYYFRKEKSQISKMRIKIDGIGYLALFVIVALFITFMDKIIASILMCAISAIVLIFGSKKNREYNGFSLHPLYEIFIIFIAIFIMVIPISSIIENNTVLINTLVPESSISMFYFWASGIMSSILDNTPTYMLFLKAGGGAEKISQSALKAISAGSVFMGALTYIGNSPNLLVKAIAQQKGIIMPSFAKYALIACAWLLPWLLLLSILYI